VEMRGYGEMDCFSCPIAVECILDVYLFGFAWSSLSIDAEVRQMKIRSWLAGAFDVRVQAWMSDVRFSLPRPRVQSTSCKTTISLIVQVLKFIIVQVSLLNPKFRSGHQVLVCRSS
jgi:hypothetical protein